MTTQGAGPPIDASREIDAYRACTLFGDLTNRFENDAEILTGGTGGDFASYKYLMFNGQTTFSVMVKGKGTLSISLDQPFHRPIGTIQIDSENAWAPVRCSLQAIHGKHSLHLIFHNGDISVKRFKFS